MTSDPETTLTQSAPSPAGSLAALLREARRGSHWAQLMRFAAVGASGYLVNLAVYAAALGAGLEYRAAATVAFVVALVNNFVWNRLWTFRDSYGRVGAQAARFVLVSTAAFLLSLAVLSVLVRDAGISKLVAQAVAIVAVTPVSFAANKLWSFGTSPA